MKQIKLKVRDLVKVLQVIKNGIHPKQGSALLRYYSYFNLGNDEKTLEIRTGDEHLTSKHIIPVYTVENVGDKVVNYGLSENRKEVWAVDYMRLQSILSTIQLPILTETSLEEEDLYCTLTFNTVHITNKFVVLEVNQVIKNEFAGRVIDNTVNINRTIQLGQVNTTILRKLIIDEEKGTTHKLNVAQLHNVMNYLGNLVEKIPTVATQIGYAIFKEDKVVSQSALVMGYMKNPFADFLTNVSLNKSALILLDLVSKELQGLEIKDEDYEVELEQGLEEKIKPSNEVELEIKMVEEENEMVIVLGQNAYRLRYNKVNKIPREEYFSYLDKSKALVIPRKYLVEAIKRTSLESKELMIACEKGQLMVKSADFYQNIPLLENNVEDFVVKTSVAMLQKALLGKNNDELIKMYINPINSNKLDVTFEEYNGIWSSYITLFNTVGYSIR